MDIEEVAFLACGWSLASPSAHATAIALRTSDGVVLVDAGGQATRGLVETFGTETLEHVYLTHEHPDHTYALPGLIHHLRFGEDRDRLTVHGPKGALQRVQGAIDALGVTHPFEIIWDELPNDEGSDQRARWTPCEHSVPTLAYRFDDVIVCGDTSPSKAVTKLASRGGLLIHEATHTDDARTHEAGHSTPRDAGDVAWEANVDALALIHIHPSLDRDKARNETRFEPTFAPRDGDVLVRKEGDWRYRDAR